jgi:hypothetical protein
MRCGALAHKGTGILYVVRKRANLCATNVNCSDGNPCAEQRGYQSGSNTQALAVAEGPGNSAWASGLNMSGVWMIWQSIIARETFESRTIGLDPTRGTGTGPWKTTGQQFSPSVRQIPHYSHHTIEPHLLPQPGFYVTDRFLPLVLLEMVVPRWLPLCFRQSLSALLVPAVALQIYSAFVESRP